MGNTVDRFMVDSMTKVWYVNSTGAEASDRDDEASLRMKAWKEKMGLLHQTHVVHLEHHLESGERRLMVNGELVHVGQSTFASAVLKFQIDESLP